MAITFDHLNALLQLQGARWNAIEVPAPTHNLRQFHIDHADAAIADAVLSARTEL